MDTTTDFIGVSAIFISGNGIVFMFLLVFTETKGGTTINKVVETLTSLNELYAEINNHITIFKVNDGTSSAISGGMQALHTNERYQHNKQKLVIIGYSFAESILIAYSVISYYFCDYYALGILNSILIQSVDILVYMYIYASIVHAPYYSVCLCLISRFFIFILTGYYWFIGYTCVY